MYLRTTSRKNRDGTVVEYYQLAHGSGPNVLHSLMVWISYEPVVSERHQAASENG